VARAVTWRVCDCATVRVALTGRTVPTRLPLLVVLVVAGRLGVESREDTPLALLRTDDLNGIGDRRARAEVGLVRP